MLGLFHVKLKEKWYLQTKVFQLQGISLKFKAQEVGKDSRRRNIHLVDGRSNLDQFLSLLATIPKFNFEYPSDYSLHTLQIGWTEPYFCCKLYLHALLWTASLNHLHISDCSETHLTKEKMSYFSHFHQVGYQYLLRPFFFAARQATIRVSQFHQTFLRDKNSQKLMLP